MRIWTVFKRLGLGLVLIVLCSAVLLLSDTRTRDGQATGVRGPVRIAVLQNVSNPTLDDGVRGMVDGLAGKGFVDGQRVTIQRYNAEGDMATAAAIAREITSGKHDMVLTVSTPCLQAVARANKDGKAVHVFALVTDPFDAGVGINRANPLEHPRHLVGYQTLQPIAESFRIARRMRPGLKIVGMVWNPAEANSQVNSKYAREACKELGIELLEATVDNSSGVAEAASALVARGAEALWVGGDSTVIVAIHSVLAEAKKGRIPVFTVIPPSSADGGLFDLGANYYQVGLMTGELAAEVLAGRNPMTIPVVNAMPEILLVNQTTLAGLRDAWQIPGDILARANILIDATGQHRKVSAGPASQKP